MTFPAGRHF